MLGSPEVDWDDGRGVLVGIYGGCLREGYEVDVEFFAVGALVASANVPVCARWTSQPRGG